MIKEKMFKRGDIVQVTDDVQKLITTQWVPQEFANEISGKEFKIECSYPDKSYDLDGTLFKLDNSVLEFVRHDKKIRMKTRLRKVGKFGYKKGESIGIIKIDDLENIEDIKNLID